MLIPLLFGTGAAWTGGELWDYGLAGNSPRPRVDQEFFAQVSQVIPLLLVALAVEANFFRDLMRGAAQRAATIVTVATMCLGELAVLSVLVMGEDTQALSLSGWHEFIGFVFGLEAVLVGLATLVWAALPVPVPPPDLQLEPEPGDVPHEDAVENGDGARKLLVLTAGVLVGYLGSRALRRRDAAEVRRSG